MYYISNTSGKIKFENQEIELNDESIGFKKFIEDKKNGVEIIYVDFFEDELNEIQNKKNEDDETILYLKRIEDAKQIWARLSARFRIKKQQGVLDDATENIILAELKPVLDIVVPFGQWITGQQLLIQIGDSVIGSELYNELFQIFDNYIQNNYSPIEIEQSKISENK